MLIMAFLRIPMTFLWQNVLTELIQQSNEHTDYLFLPQHHLIMNTTIHKKPQTVLFATTSVLSVFIFITSLYFFDFLPVRSK